jgi:cytidyltransferase-like protein
MIVTIADLPKLRQKHPGQKLVAASGVFDLLHVGHVQYLQVLKDYGDITVVMVKPNARIRQLKHANRPIINETERARMVDAIKGVDYVVIGSNIPNKPGQVDAMYEEFLEALQPDVYVATNDAWGKLAEVTKADVHILPRTTAGELDSTTSILEKIQGIDGF